MNRAAPLYLLTGFLGSGKTTLLARLLKQPGLADTAVVVNEFGEVGLDHLLVATAQDDNVLLLDSGCLCCELANGLNETLEGLYYRRERGEIPPFSRVVVETSGLADPEPVLAGLMADRHLAARFPLGAVIATVDGLNARAQLDRYEELRRQAAMADRLIVTKTDATGGRIDPALAAALAGLNPTAEVIEAQWGEVPPDRLLAPPAASRRPAPDATAHHSHLSTIFLPRPDPMEWEDYGALIVRLRRTFGERLLRTKGLIRIAGEDGVKAIQGVGQVFAPPADIAAPTDARLGLVLIGEKLDPAELSLSATEA